jgi:hypothetical protein
MTDPDRLHELCRLRSVLEAFAVRRWPRSGARSRLEGTLRRRLAGLKQLAAEENVLAACARHGKKAGILLRAGMSAAACRQKGFSLLALGVDGGCLRQGFDQLLKTARGV